MYIIGFQNENMPGALINPVGCRTATDLFDWISNFLNERDFALDTPITHDGLVQALRSDQPVIIKFKGYRVWLMLGEDWLVETNTSRYVYTDSFVIE